MGVQVLLIVFMNKGFRKIDPDKWEFANEGFLRGQKHLLKNIRRRRTSSSSHQSLPLQQGSLEPSVEDGIYGVEEEVGRLKRDKQVLLAELVKIKQQQQTTRTYLKSMENRLQNAESKQQQMMNFLAKAIKNPGFLQQLSQQNGRRKALEELLSKKRNRYIDSSSSSSSVGRFRTDGVNGMMNHVKDEPSISDYGGGYQVSELEALAFEMQGFGRPGKEVRDDADHGVEEEEGCRIRELDDEFWNELFTEEMSDNSGGSQRSI